MQLLIIGTFIYFEQYGLETSRYEKFVAYLGPSGDYCMEGKEASGDSDAEESSGDSTDEEASGESTLVNDQDEARPGQRYFVSESREIAKLPSATKLVRESVNFVERLNLDLYGYLMYWTPFGIRVVDGFIVSSKLKPTLSIMEEPEVSPLPPNTLKPPQALDEKLESLYVFRDDSEFPKHVSIYQTKPYSFMPEVVRRAEIMFRPSGTKYILADVGNVKDGESYSANWGTMVKDELPEPDERLYKLVEDFRYYNQDDKMPHWYDLREKVDQLALEAAYLEAFNDVYVDPEYYWPVRSMVAKEYGILESSIIKFVPYRKVKYTHTGRSATLYDGSSKHVDDDGMKKARTGNYQVSYYWDALYVIEEKELQMRQKIHHVRMPVLLVKYYDSWAKGVEYENNVWQNPLYYKSYKQLIPDAKTSLGLADLDLKEKQSHYRVDTFKKYYNKKEKSEKTGIKESDVLDMLVLWEDYGNRSDDYSQTAFAYMRELYKLTLCIRDLGGEMLENAYTYLYIPASISNYKDSTLQKIFWLERLAINEGEDELTESEQATIRAKAQELRWQTLEYDEYYECLEDKGDEEEAKVYALFPFGASCVRAYYMLHGLETINGYGDGHNALDMYSRTYIANILQRNTDEGENIYFYELNRLTIAYMIDGNRVEDAFVLAEDELNKTLKAYKKYSPVVAIAPGYVQAVDYNARSGFYVSIAHDKMPDNEDEYAEGNGAEITSFYAHLKRWPLVEVGDIVGAGTILGYEGTTGRSTGNHLHFSIETNGGAVDPEEYLLPVFSPFYHDEKALEVLEKDEEFALGTEYYTLERTILPENRLFKKYNKIDGRTLIDGTVIDYEVPNGDGAPYKSGEEYIGGADGLDLIWGNNVPEKELASSMEEIIDGNLLHLSIPYKSGETDDAAGEDMQYGKDEDMMTNPDFFGDSKGVEILSERINWPRWFAVEMAEYKSPRVVPCYNGPTSADGEIETEEQLNDLKSIQQSLRKAGYYGKAGVKWEDAGYGTYSDEFVEVVETMQQDLLDKGYDRYEVEVNGELDVQTMSCFNNLMQYTTNENQHRMDRKTMYNSGVDLSMEPAFQWAIVTQECEWEKGEYEEGEAGNYLALKEAKEKEQNEEEWETIEFNDYEKQINRKQGLMQIGPKMATERYAEDKIKSGDAVLFIRAPMRNTNVGIEVLKEYALYLYELCSGDIDEARNWILYENGTDSDYWKEQYITMLTPSTRWCDPENIDKLFLYALVAESYEKRAEGGPRNVAEGDGSSINKDRAREILGLDGGDGPDEYTQKVIKYMQEYIMDDKK